MRKFKAIKENKISLLVLFLYTCITVFFCSKMSPFYPIQEWSDVNLYFNIGKAVMNSQTLYTEVFDHKGPLIFLIYGIGYLISNDSFVGMFIIQIISWTILIFTAYFIAKLFLNKISSTLAAILFLPFFISHTLQGGSAEEFIAVSMAISLYFFVFYFKQARLHSPKHMYIHGLMWGITFFIKFNLVVFWIFPLLAIGCFLLIKKEYKLLIKNLLSFILGAITITLPILIYFLSKGAFNDAIDIYFILNSSSKIDSITIIFNRIAVSFYQQLRFQIFEFLFLLMGAFIFPLIFIKNRIYQIAISLTFLSLFGVIFMSGYVYYYSIPYYIFIILGLIVVLDLTSKYLVNNKIGIILIVFSVTVCTSISIYRKGFFDKYEAQNMHEANNVIEKFLPHIVNEKEDKSLLNLALDDANALFTYANIMPNIPYFIAPNLPYEVYPKIRDEQTKYIESSKTKFVILAEYSLNANYFSNLKALHDNYELIDKFGEYYSWHHVDRYYYLYKRK